MVGILDDEKMTNLRRDQEHYGFGLRAKGDDSAPDRESLWNDYNKYAESGAEHYSKFSAMMKDGFSAEGLAELGDLMMKNITPEAKNRLHEIFRNTMKDLADKGLVPWRVRLAEVDEAKRVEIEKLSDSLAEQLNLNVHIQGSEQAVAQFFTDLQNIEVDQVESKLTQLLTPTSTAQISESSAFGFLYMLDRENGDGDQWLVSAVTLGKIVDRESARVAQELKTAEPGQVADIFGSIFKPEYVSTENPDATPHIMIGLSNKE